MKFTNNTIFIFTVIMIVYSLAFNMFMLHQLSQKSITGKASLDGQVGICVGNRAPYFVFDNCTGMRLYFRVNNFFKFTHHCTIKAVDPENDSFVLYITHTPWATINNVTGDINLSGNITNPYKNPPAQIELAIEAHELGQRCSRGVNATSVTWTLLGDNFTGGIRLIQNYPSDETDKLTIKEAYTTYHKSLDDYFIDLEGNTLYYEIEFLDWFCYNIQVNVDPDTNLVSYTAPRGFDTSQTGPCTAKWRAYNYYNLENYSNFFYITVEHTEPPKAEENNDKQQSGGGGSSNIGSTGETSSGGTGKTQRQCYLRNVFCTNWTECRWEPPNTTEIAFYDREHDGLKTRECSWMTNCPGELAPSRKRICDYKPTCNDSLKNCHEIGDNDTWCEEKVDCGGPCPACPTCDDWILNQNEKGIDCGGPCPKCSTCNDNIKDCIKVPGGGLLCEENIDCGGYCSPCANCSDGVRNCHRLENGSISCEEGIDCGGPCSEKCSEVEQAVFVKRIRLLNWFLLFLILIGVVLAFKHLYPKLYAYYERKYMDYLKRMMQRAQNRFKQNYIRHFEEQIKYLQSDFDNVTNEKAKEEGDKLLIGGETTGYNIDRYSVSFDNDYADILTDNSVMTVNYAMYINNIGHGKRILKEITKLGIRPNYKVCKRSSATRWDERWSREESATYEMKNDKLIARSVEYVISFKPKDMEEAKKIIQVLEMYGKGSQRKIEDAWDVPDIRVTGKDQFLDFEKHVLNTRTIGGQKLLILTKDKVLPDFEDSNLWLNPGLAKFIK